VFGPRSSVHLGTVARCKGGSGLGFRGSVLGARCPAARWLGARLLGGSEGRGSVFGARCSELGARWLGGSVARGSVFGARCLGARCSGLGARWLGGSEARGSVAGSVLGARCFGVGRLGARFSGLGARSSVLRGSLARCSVARRLGGSGLGVRGSVPTL
jgi:hypothetical protein